MFKKSLIYLLTIIIVLIFTGCSSKYNYTVEPTPLKEGVSKYKIRQFDFTLKHGYGRNIHNTTFKNEKELKESFEKFMHDELKEKNILGDENSFQVDIVMEYTRNYLYRLFDKNDGSSLKKPSLFYTIKVFSLDNKLLVEYSSPQSTTQHSFFEELSIGFEMALSKWNAEDEPRDIKLISTVLVRDLFELGD